MTTPEPWSILADIAGYLQVSEAAVLRWIAQRKLPAHRVGRIWRFTISEVDAWVRSAAGKIVPRIRTALGFDLERREASTWTEALRSFNEQADAAGIFVLGPQP